jgi:hypothetical protein
MNLQNLFLQPAIARFRCGARRSQRSESDQDARPRRLRRGRPARLQSKARRGAMSINNPAALERLAAAAS